MAIPADQLPVGEGLSPDGTPGMTFFVSRALLDTLREDGPEDKHDDARFIPEAIGRPDAIFEGLLRPDRESCLCYSVRPTHDPDEADEEGPPRYGYVFAVYAERAVGGLLIFDWEWREEDGDEPGHPTNRHGDFERRTWHRT